MPFKAASNLAACRSLFGDCPLSFGWASSAIRAITWCSKWSWVCGGIEVDSDFGQPMTVARKSQ